MPTCQITPANEVTVKNLMTAFESESNAQAQYTAYAERADSEGLRRVARLLRAIARSEQIHADNHAAVIRKLGGEPEVQFQEVEVHATPENLTAALEDEIYAVDSMYPRFLVENRNIENSAARTFTWALEAKKTHTRLLSEEIRKMEAGIADTTTEDSLGFYVRPVCGYVSKGTPPERCWVCNRFCATFETIR
ncbi:MAG: rubrerythrin family protein [Terracidiphilus sp.]|jgi:rubrerythrin